MISKRAARFRSRHWRSGRRRARARRFRSAECRHTDDSIPRSSGQATSNVVFLEWSQCRLWRSRVFRPEPKPLALEQVAGSRRGFVLSDRGRGRAMRRAARSPTWRGSADRKVSCTKNHRFNLHRMDCTRWCSPASPTGAGHPGGWPGLHSSWKAPCTRRWKRGDIVQRRGKYSLARRRFPSPSTNRFSGARSGFAVAIPGTGAVRRPGNRGMFPRAG